MKIKALQLHKAIIAFVAISITLLVVSGILVLANVSRLAPLIVIHFDALRGADVFGTRASVWGIWLLGFAINLVNSALAYEFYHRERLLSYLYLGANVLISLLLLIGVGVMVSIN